MPAVQTRVNGDVTRSRIFAAAKKLFPLYGFKGTSTQMLALKAKVNEALIFHHFKNKEELWKRTKNAILEEPNFNLKIEDDNLEICLRNIIEQRFNMFDNSPDLLKMLQWQRLENKKGKIQGGNIGSPEHWIKVFKKLQSENKMKKELDPALVTIMISNAVSGALMDDHVIFGNASKKKEYIDLLVETFQKC